MSGGDGKDSRGPTGGVKGGPTGIGGGGHSGSHNDPYIRDSNGTAVGIKPGYHAEPSKEKPGSDGSHGDHINITGGVNAVPDDPSPNDKGNGGKGNGVSGPNGGNGFNGVPGHPNVADAGQLGGDNSDKHDYHVRDGESVYSVLVDKDGNISFVSKIKSPPKNEHDTRLSGNDDAGKQYARNQVQAYLNEKKQAEEKAAAEDKAKADAEAEAKRKAEEEAKRQQEEWDAQHQEEAAQRQINEAQQRIDQAQQDKNNADQRTGQHDGAANNIQNEQNAIRQEQQRLNDEFTKFLKTGAMSDTSSARYQTAMQLHRQSELEKEKADAKQGDIDRERNAANQARNEANQAQQRVEQAQREKTEAENRLNTLRAERKARQVAEAKRKADEEAAKAAAEAKRKADEEAKEKEEEAVKDAVKFTASFYKEVFKVYGEKAEKLSKLLADQAKGKKIRNVEDALKSYEKYKANINKKINAKDREAIAKALESVDVGKAAKNIAKFSKGLLYVGPAIDVVDWVTELIKAVKTDNWRSLYVKTETIAIGLAATHVTALAFGAVLGGPVGILGYGLIMAGVGALVNETIVDEANKVIGI